MKVRINVKPGDPLAKIFPIISFEWHTEDARVLRVLDWFKLNVALGALCVRYESC